MTEETLETDLIELSRRFSERGNELILGGGFGLLLKQRYVERDNLRTLLDEIPNTRATGDLDIFLQVEMITDEEDTHWLRQQIDDLGYSPEVKYFKFSKTVSSEAGDVTVEIDLLTPDPEDHPGAHVSDIRVRPRDYSYPEKKLHAYKTPEAISVVDKATKISIGGEEEILVPNTFSYLMLKLMAYRDRKDREEDADSEEARKGIRRQANAHAYDVFVILGLTTEEEWNRAMKLSEKYLQQGPVREVKRIINDYFSDESQPGFVSIQEHARNTNKHLDNDFLEDMPSFLDELY